MNALLLVAAFLAVVFASCIAVEGYPVEASIIAQNSTIINGTEPFVWDFWRINKPPIIGGLIVLVVGVIVGVIAGGIYYWKKRRDAKKSHDEHEDMHRLEDEDH